METLKRESKKEAVGEGEVERQSIHVRGMKEKYSLNFKTFVLYFITLYCIIFTVELYQNALYVNMKSNHSSFKKNQFKCFGIALCRERICTIHTVVLCFHRRLTSLYYMNLDI